YARTGYLSEARKLLSEMQAGGLKGDVIAWTAVISAYARNARPGDALNTF
ncbi:hypothetical protein KI387_013279, partial [Taxus chinensis]